MDQVQKNMFSEVEKYFIFSKMVSGIDVFFKALAVDNTESIHYIDGEVVKISKVRWWPCASHCACHR
ncbi:hypothetical protein [Deinococcus misasensis]|uniref:hypothetical protein n=1 Tax=Deinococcus misasensis TaxID=392413 RepID=UPI000554AA22|nr:hypothetical protein [Deinococcus misasensis]